MATHVLKVSDASTLYDILSKQPTGETNRALAVAGYVYDGSLWRPLKATTAGEPQVQLSGSSTQVATLLNNSNATGPGPEFTVLGMAGVVIQITGTFVASLEIQGLVSGSEWRKLAAMNAEGSRHESITGNGIFFVNVMGLEKIRANVTSYASGSITAVARAAPLEPALDVTGSIAFLYESAQIRDIAAHYFPGNVDIDWKTTFMQESKAKTLEFRNTHDVALTVDVWVGNTKNPGNGFMKSVYGASVPTNAVVRLSGVDNAELDRPWRHLMIKAQAASAPTTGSFEYYFAGER